MFERSKNLGRINQPQTIVGIVLFGSNQGSKVGAKTANLDVELAKKMIKGLYSCQVNFAGKSYRGLLYYGLNSLTGRDCLEVHILDFNGDLYNKKISVTADKYLRFPKKFKTAKDLSEQIKKDLANYRAFLKLSSKLRPVKITLNRRNKR